MQKKKKKKKGSHPWAQPSVLGGRAATLGRLVPPLDSLIVVTLPALAACRGRLEGRDLPHATFK